MRSFLFFSLLQINLIHCFLSNSYSLEFSKEHPSPMTLLPRAHSLPVLQRWIRYSANFTWFSVFKTWQVVCVEVGPGMRRGRKEQRRGEDHCRLNLRSCLADEISEQAMFRINGNRKTLRVHGKAFFSTLLPIISVLHWFDRQQWNAVCQVSC